MSMQSRIESENTDEAQAAVVEARKPGPGRPRKNPPTAAEGDRRFADAEDPRVAPVPAGRRPLSPGETASLRSADLPAERPQAPERPPQSRTRKPFGSMEQKLAAPERPGYRRYWFNDEPGRIIRAAEAGYSHVDGVDGQKISRVVGKLDGGHAQIAFLMEIPVEWYMEDMQRDQNEWERTMTAIKGGKTTGLENSYVPEQGITLKRGSA